MIIVRPRLRVDIGVLIALLGLALPLNAVSGQKLDWPEATARIVNLRPRAISCAQALKTYGRRAQIAAAALDYADAKSDIDAAIATLMVASSPRAGRASLPALQARIASAGGKLQKFCAVARAVIPSSTGQKGWIDDIAKASIEPLIKAASAGIAALYAARRTDDELTRQSIQTQLRAAKWPIFSEISAQR